MTATARLAGVIFVAAVLARAAGAQFVQQGAKLVGTGAVGTANQGDKVAISADGGTVILGGPNDDAITGAAWVFTRAGDAWAQQGAKLVGTGAVGPARQGSSVGVSGDGNTAVVCGEYDANYTGACWVFARSGDVWSQQGAKLVGTGAVGAAFQGVSAAISADGATIIVGGPEDDSGVGAAWVFARAGGAWPQQGGKLTGAGAVGGAAQGWSVALSADGDTAVVGAPGDDANAGAAWVYRRGAGLWSQQGAKLVGTGAAGAAQQGVSVAVSADGDTIVVGGNADDAGLGAAWAYTLGADGWSQQGGKLTGADASSAGRQGVSSALSADGSTAIVGGWRDGAGTGAAWVYRRRGEAWSQLGSKLVGADAVGPGGEGISVAISADGDTALVGGWADDDAVGAAWVWECGAPAITAQPRSVTVRRAQSATLAVAAAGAAPLAFQWYRGDAGDTSTPVGSDADAFATPPLAATARYWVRVTNPCGAADSAVATVTVAPGLRRHVRAAR